MKQFLTTCLLSVVGMMAYAQMGDAYKGILPVTDQTWMKSLNGEWQLKVVKGVADDKTVPPADASWRSIPVPGCWETYGFSEPRYNYPDSLTGYYRMAFTVPDEWKGQQVIIRLDGVLRGYDLWLNDRCVGSWESGFNTCLFDLTPYLRKNGEQQLAMRVYSHFKGYEFDCNDDWAPMGIYRDVTLFAVPKTHLSNLTVTTRMDGQVTVLTEVANATKQTSVDYEILDATGDVVSTGEKIQSPHLWTAETPYLYTLKVNVRQKGQTLQTITQKIGIREISIDGNVLKLNGRPIKLRGVNVHSTDPWTVKVISDALTLKDMKMMKDASVNFLRLSHYPREPRFYELADSLGFYLVDEIPFGYGDKHLPDRSYQDILKTRSLATITRDKNHPSVIVWSVGNENPLPETCVEVGEYVGQLDTSRPYCFPQVGSFFRRFFEGSDAKGFPSPAPVFAPHYPSTGQLEGLYQRLDRPIIFTEYCHTLGISLEDHDRMWEIIERTPGIAGGGVWEWADQGMPFTEKGGGGKWRTDGSERDQRVFTTMDGGFEMSGNLGTDGLVYADRTPLPNYYELQHNYARAFISSVSSQAGEAAKSDDDNTTRLTVTNRYDFLNLKDNVTFHWTLTNNRDTVLRGAFSPDVAPRSTSTYDLKLPGQKGLSLLQLDISDAQGHVFLHQSFVLNKPQLNWEGRGNPMAFVQEGPLVRTGRKPTMAERLTQKNRLPMPYLLSLQNEQVKADVQTTEEGTATKVSFSLAPDSSDVFHGELGLAYLLDRRFDRVQWLGQGPFASYPGRHQACRYGYWAKHQDDLYFEGNHEGVEAALFSDAEGNGLLITAPVSSEEALNLNFEQTDRGIVVTVNAAVSGQGPKSSKTHFPGWSKEKGAVSGQFMLYRIDAAQMPQLVKSLFDNPAAVPAPFHPFLTQYDTYLLRYADIKR